MYKTFRVLLVIIGLLSLPQNLDAQTKLYSKNGIAIDGYDLVAYFENKAQKGSPKFSLKHGNQTLYFSSQNNKDAFIKNPKQYLPQYGAYCAYAMAKSGRLVSINPNTFELRNNKLYLFYNKGKHDTLDYWLKQKPEELVKKADHNWETKTN